MENKSQNLLIIFTRNIVLGKCKTRLAKTVGPEIALEIYSFLVEHTSTISKNLDAQKWVFYSEFRASGDLFDDHIFEKYHQVGEDLGERMHNAFSLGFEKGYEKIIVIGSDIYDLRESDLNTAFEALDNAQYVVGPAKDGGYYLLGMKAPNAGLFKNKHWGTDKVLAETLKTINGSSVILLDERNDVDTYDDIGDEAVFQKFLKDWRG
ncbi:MAG: TIGR04282 family arsenosugar biosynthesis glycosyltransferase [Flavobacteriaceae bacterium]